MRLGVLGDGELEPTVLHPCPSSASSPSSSSTHGQGSRQGDPTPALIEAERLLRWVSREHLLSNECCGISSWGQDFCFFRPAAQKYPPFQWQWDEAMHMVVWAHMDIGRSARSMRSMLSMQQPDGRVPHVIFWLPESGIEPRTALTMAAVLLLVSGLTLLLCSGVSRGKSNRTSSSLTNGARPLGLYSTEHRQWTGWMAFWRRCSFSFSSLSCPSSLRRGHRRTLTGVSITLLALALCMALACMLLLPEQHSFSDDRVSDLVQTPLLPWALRRMVDLQPRRDLREALAREFMPPLVAYLEWWATTRDVNGDGLVSILHPWESGLDSSPVYDVFHASLEVQRRKWAAAVEPEFVLLETAGDAVARRIERAGGVDMLEEEEEDYFSRVAEEGWSHPAKEDIYPHFAQWLLKYSGPGLAWNQTSILSEEDGAGGPGGKQGVEDDSVTGGGHYWQQRRRYQRGERAVPSFRFKDVGVNAVYAAGWAVLRDLASSLPEDEVLHLDLRGGGAAAAAGDGKTGEEAGNVSHLQAGLLEGLARGLVTAGHVAQFCDARYRRALSAIQSRMWSQQHQRFVSLYTLWGKQQDLPSRVEVAQTLFPLLLPDLDRDKVEAIVHGQLLQPSKFWRRFPVTSVSADSSGFKPAFRDNLMWRGPSWPVLSWIATEGLLLQGFHKEARALVLRWAEMVLRSGVWEQYSPETGAGFGPRGLGMSTSLVDALRRVEFVGEASVPDERGEIDRQKKTGHTR